MNTNTKQFSFNDIVSVSVKIVITVLVGLLKLATLLISFLGTVINKADNSIKDNSPMWAETAKTAAANSASATVETLDNGYLTVKTALHLVENEDKPEDKLKIAAVN